MGLATFDPYWFPCDGPWLGIPHAWNVLTNLPYLVLGLVGLRALGRVTAAPSSRRPWFWFWMSTAWLGIWSGMYHVFLTPFTLGMDRVCIAGMTAALCWQALVGADGGRDRPWRGAWLMLGFQVPVILWYAVGLTSLVYGLTQAAAAVLLLVVYLRRKRADAPRPPGWPLLALVLCYAGAKLLELGDQAICDATGCIGGHPFKHLLAALGLTFLVPYMKADLRTSSTA